MKNTMLNRLLSVVMVVALLASMLVMPVSATTGEDDGTTGEGTSQTGDAQTGGENETAEDEEEKSDIVSDDETDNQSDDQSDDQTGDEENDDTSNVGNTDEGTDEGTNEGSEDGSDDNTNNQDDSIAPINEDGDDDVNTTYVAYVNGTGYTTFDQAMTAAYAMTGDVTVEIYDKVTLNTSLSGNYNSIKFVGKDTDAEIYLDVQGYITATGKKVAFEALTLSKSEGAYITNAGFMNVAFGVYDVVSVDYTRCIFANGAYASSGTVTFTGCTFYRSYEKYGLWAYGDADITVSGGSFAIDRGIKMYAEGAAKVTNLTVTGVDFSAVTAKPAIVLTYGKSVTLSGNTYSSTGVFELETDNSSNGTTVITNDTNFTCDSDNGACGVLVGNNGTYKIYNTVAAAAAAAQSGDTVIILYSTNESANFADGVTVVKPVKLTCGYTEDLTTGFRVWGQAEEVKGAASPFVVELYSNGNKIATTTLTDTSLLETVNEITWGFWYGVTDSYWNTVWEEGHPNSLAQPDKVVLYLGNEKVAENNTVKMISSEAGASVVWKDLPGVTNVIDLSAGSYTITEPGEYVVKSGYNGPNTLTVDCDSDEEVKVTIEDLNITADADQSAISIVDGNVTLVSTGTNALTGGNNGAGIYVSEDASLTITGTGSLTAIGNAGVDDASGAAGIGGAYGKGSSGAITIDNTTVTAYGYGTWASGIGSAGGSVGTINILNGANVTAYGGYYANGAGTHLQTSYGSGDPEGGAAIGGGSKDGAGVGTINITGSTVTAYGGSKAAGIGAMFWNSVDAINIESSNVTAQGGSSSAGIGTSRAGSNGVSANISISGGTVNATGGDYGAGIGGGYNADSLTNLNTTTISINGAIVNATGGMGGAGIGGGYKTNNLDIDITGGDVTATAGALVSGKTVEQGGAACAIGSGANGSGTFNGSSIDIGDSATVKVSAYAGGKNAIETMTNAEADAKENITVLEEVTGLSGEGTADSPYLINNLAELIWFRDKVDEQAADGSTQFAGKYFKLTDDINLAGIDWNPIGSMSGDHGSFKGVFDGDGHTISNLTINSTEKGAGLFAYTSGDAEIKNLTLNNVTINSTADYVGAVVGNAYASTKISDVHVTGDVNISGRGYIGGIAGHGYVVMEDVSVNANAGSAISSTFWCAGGILGYAGEGTTNISNAEVSNLTIKSAAGGLGSIIGMAEDNNGTQPISVSNLSASNVVIKTYAGGYSVDTYGEYALGYLVGGNDTTKFSGTNTANNVTFDLSTGNTNPEVSDAVASVNGVIYFDLASAIAAANGGTVTLLRDITAAQTVEITNDLTLDLNGKTLTGNIKVASAAEVEIKNGYIVNTDVDYSAVESTGTLTLDGVDIESARHAVRIEGGKATVISGTYKTTGTAGYTTHAINVSGDGTVVNITGGEFIGPNGTNGDSGAAVNVQPGSTVNISDGKFSGGLNDTLASAGTLSITGGTYDQNPSKYVADDYKVVQNAADSWTVRKAQYVAEVNGTKYETLAEAIIAAEDGVTITLLANATLTNDISVNKKVVIDAAGNTITAAEDDVTLAANSVKITGLGQNGKLGFVADKVEITDNGTIKASSTANSDYGTISTIVEGNKGATVDTVFVKPNDTKLVITPKATDFDFEGEYMVDKNKNDKLDSDDLYVYFPTYDNRYTKGTSETLYVESTGFYDTCTKITLTSNSTGTVYKLYEKFTGYERTDTKTSVGCTKLTLKSGFLNTLAVGAYTVTFEHTINGKDYYVADNVLYIDASAYTADSSNPKTGDDIMMAVSVMTLSAAALAVLFVFDRKRKAL